MVHSRSDLVWADLLRDMRERRCIPFVGAGACAGVLPGAGEMARRMILRFAMFLPPELTRNPCATLAQIAQAVELRSGRRDLTEFLRRELHSADRLPAIHQALARLPFSIYVTTNYDDLLERALHAEGRNPFLLLLPDRFRCETMVLDDGLAPFVGRLELPFEPSPHRPLVFHLHGHVDRPESMVVTEVDYFRSLVGFAGGAMLLPTELFSRLASSSILFLGYSLSDWNVRLLFYAIHNRLGHTNSALIWSPPSHHEPPMYAADYLNLFAPAQIVFGDADDFAAELLDRWSKRG